MFLVGFSISMREAAPNRISLSRFTKLFPECRLMKRLNVGSLMFTRVLTSATDISRWKLSFRYCITFWIRGMS